MKPRQVWLLAAAIVLALIAFGTNTQAGVRLGQTVAPGQGDPDAWKGEQVEERPVAASPNHLTHPCSGMFPEPPFMGLSPLSIAWVSGMCSSGYGDIAVWQSNGHSYAALSGFALRMFHIWNVDDPYNPVHLVTQPFPSGGSASTAIFDFKQFGHDYLALTMRGSGTGCGYFIYNVDNPAAPVLRVRQAGTDWCTVHETFVSHDAAGNADYAWLTMSGETGSGDKIVVLTLPDLSLPNPILVQTGRYERPDRLSFIHDSNVVGNRVFVAHWSGGMQIFDKETLANNTDPAPLNPVDSIRPSGFLVHHVVPTSDGNHVFIQDEFNTTTPKVKLYNISNINAPTFERDILGEGTASNAQAHNIIMKPLGPNLDLMLNAWYRAGTRGYLVDTSGASTVLTLTLSHQLRQTAGSGFGNVWGVDWLPCTIRGQARTCIYSGDMTYGLVVDALGYDPLDDPYDPESQISSPTQGQVINQCTFTISGSAHDYYSGIGQVEVSTDDGATWNAAQGTNNWTYEWTIPADGAYALKVRATDLAGNLQSPAPAVNVTVAGGCAPATPTATATPTTPDQLVGHVTWQGRPPQPHQLQVLPITITLKSAATEVNYPTRLTDASGFFTVSLGSLPLGTYNWRADDSTSALHSPNYLANSGQVSLLGDSITQVEMGLMEAGDANNDNVVNIADFNILRSSFGKSVGDPGYDDRADFNGDNAVNIADFNLLRANFGNSGAPPAGP
jgi:hypothetical protein